MKKLILIAVIIGAVLSSPDLKKKILPFINSFIKTAQEKVDDLSSSLE